MKFITLILFLFAGNRAVLFAQAEVTLPYQQISIGVDYKALNGKYIDTTSVQNLQTKMYGISGQFQSSFIIGYLSKREHRFLIGDLLQSQLGLGVYQTNNPDIKSNILPYYQFDFGLRTIFKLNKNNDIGIDLMILSFGRDRVSSNTSGSFSTLRYRFKHHVLSIGVKARRDRIFGWIQQYFSPSLLIPPQYMCSYSYLFKTHNIGFTLDYMYDRNYTYIQFHINPLYNYNIRLFYGVCF